MGEEKLKKLNNYFDIYIDRMIIKDIELVKEKNSELKFSYPYILSASAENHGFSRGRRRNEDPSTTKD